MNSDDQGFSLVEMLVALAVFALLSAVILPQFLQARQHDVERIARDIHAMLQKANVSAKVNGIARSVRGEIDQAGHYVWSDGQQKISIPSSVRVRVKAAKIEDSEVAFTLLFLPGNGSTGTRIELFDGPNTYVISADWLTGHVSFRKSLTSAQ